MVQGFLKMPQVGVPTALPRGSTQVATTKGLQPRQKKSLILMRITALQTSGLCWSTRYSAEDFLIRLQFAATQVTTD